MAKTSNPTPVPASIKSFFGVVLESVHEWEWPWVCSVDLGLSELLVSGVKEISGETPATQPSDLTSNIKASCHLGRKLKQSTHPHGAWRGRYSVPPGSISPPAIPPTLESHTPSPGIYTEDEGGYCWKGSTSGDDYKQHGDSFRN